MRLNSATLIVGSVVVAAWAALVSVLEPTAVRAETEKDEYVVNRLIDCSTNPAYSDSRVAKTFETTTNTHMGQNQQCNACHMSDHPSAGMGDRPQARGATVLIANDTSEPIRYQIREGISGEWQEKIAKPGHVDRYTYPYARANQNRSPVYYVKFEGDSGGKERKLIPLATPNKHLGNIYFFNKVDNSDDVRLYTTVASVARQQR